MDEHIYICTIITYTIIPHIYIYIYTSYTCHVVDIYIYVLLYEYFYLGVATNRRHGFTRAEAEDLKAPERYVRDGDVIGPQPVFQVVA